MNIRYINVQKLILGHDRNFCNWDDKIAIVDVDITFV